MTPLDAIRDLPASAATPLHAVKENDYATWLDTQPKPARNWLASTNFRASPGSVGLFPRADTSAFGAVIVIGGELPVWDFAAAPTRLPAGHYRLEPGAIPGGAETAVLGWALGAYRYRDYAADDNQVASLVWPQGIDRAAITSAVEATYVARDLINTPAQDLGPAELAAAAKSIAAAFAATCTVTTGNSLLLSNYPAIHRVGQASRREPRLIDLRWGAADAPKVTLVGKGVCFDTGGLDLKPSSAMRLMKKDMGGAAVVLGLARMIMSAALPVRLRILIPAVDNAVSDQAMRPLDIIRTRSGLTVEIGNTDAEGRLILADALTEATSEQPDLLVDCATLTGAARVAVGTELPAMFCNDEALAEALLARATEVGDPVWRLPLWKPYRRHIESRTADLTNAPASSYGGAITAALFLAEFVDAPVPWVHLDLMAWNVDSRPGRPEGGEAMGMRALFALIASRYRR